jgi:propanol-preferring alcohol dehydrogenase
MEVATPKPADDELLLRIVACGTCRTDLQLCEGDLAARRLPVIPGHQAVGRVEVIGRAVRNWTIGERAGVAWLGGACGACRHCRTGRENLCIDAEFTGWDRDGGYAEFMTVRANFALRLPADFDDLTVAPLLCGGVIGYRALNISGIEPGGRLGLYGFGASASLAIQVARHWDCEVYVVTRSMREQERARSLGAVWTGSPDEVPPEPLDAAVTFAPAGNVVVAALRAIDRGATVAINAIHLDRIPEFAYEHLWWERGLRSVANFTRRDAQEFLDLAVKIPIVTTVEPFALADANRALARLSRGEATGTAVLTA